MLLLCGARCCRSSCVQRYRLDTLGAIIVFGVAVLIYLLAGSENIDYITGGLAGVAIVWASNFTVSMNFNVVYSTDLEAKLTSLERIKE